MAAGASSPSLTAETSDAIFAHLSTCDRWLRWRDQILLVRKYGKRDDTSQNRPAWQLALLERLYIVHYT